MKNPPIPVRSAIQTFMCFEALLHSFSQRRNEINVTVRKPYFWPTGNVHSVLMFCSTLKILVYFFPCYAPCPMTAGVVRIRVRVTEGIESGLILRCIFSKKNEPQPIPTVDVISFPFNVCIMTTTTELQYFITPSLYL